MEPVVNECHFSITIQYGSRTLEWRPETGPPSSASPSPFLAHSRWELSMMKLLTEEFQAWLKEQGL